MPPIDNKIFRCIHINTALNEQVVIDFFPVYNTNNFDAEIIELPPECFVLEEVNLYGWNNDVAIGLANPVKAVINIKFDMLKDYISEELQTYFFESLLRPSLKKTIYPGNEFEYDTYLSNYIKVTSDTFGVISLMQDIYSEINMGFESVEVKLSCTELISYLLKVMHINTVLYVINNMETLGTKDVDWAESIYAYDWLNSTDQSDVFRIKQIGYNQPPNRFYMERVPLFFAICGVLAFNGADGSLNVNANYLRTTIEPITYVNYDLMMDEQRMYFNNLRNGFYAVDIEGRIGNARLKFMNVKSLYNSIFREMLQLLNLYQINNSEVNIELNFDYFYKQRYDGSNVRGDLIESDNYWFLYDVRGHGTYIAETQEYLDNEQYFTNQNIKEQLDYACVYDLFCDLFLSSVATYLIKDNQIVRFNPQLTYDINIKYHAIEKNISFNYKIVNIQTGKMDLLKDKKTEIINPTSGSLANINIPQLYFNDAIDASRAISHTANPKYTISSGGFYYEPYDINLVDIFRTDDEIIYRTTLYVGAKINNDLPDNGVGENWSNYPGEEINGFGLHFVNTYNNFVGNYTKAVDGVNLNTPNFSILKMWYKQSYNDFANPDPTDYRSLKIQPAFDATPAFVAAHHNNVTSNTINLLGDLKFLTAFDWRWNGIDIGEPRNFSQNANMGSLLNVLCNSVCLPTFTFKKLIARYVEYKKLSEQIFNKYWQDYIRSVINYNTNPIVLTFILSAEEYRSMFGTIKLNELYNYIFNMNISDNPVYSILNQQYKIAKIDFMNNNIQLSFITINSNASQEGE